MKIDLEKLKELVEAGDASALEKHILNEALEKSDVYSVLENGDIKAAAEANKDVLSELDSLKDTHHTTAMNTFKEKKLPALLEAAKNEVRKEFNQDETPEQKQIRELTEAFNKERQKNARAEVREKLLALATSDEIGLNAVFATKHVEKFIPTAIEFGENGEFDASAIVDGVKNDLVAYATDIKSVVSAGVEEAMKGTARNDLGGGAGGGANPPKVETLGEKLAKQNQQADAKSKQDQFFGQ